jgi:GTP-binding protein HflX
MLDHSTSPEKAILVHIDLGQYAAEDALQEFTELAVSAGAEPVSSLVVKRHKLDPKYCMGTGKVEEIKQLLQVHHADLVLINASLTPSQQRNLESAWRARVVDRIGLILDIFAKRARTYEGKLQVELAQLEYLSSRLVRGWTHLERQKGGIGLRGPGETQLETDRRLVRDRVKKIKSRLENVRRQREQSGKMRQASETPVVSLVGYTNAGKSTLFNRLTRANVYAQNQLFATLDPTLRRVWLAHQEYIVLADTVGFIRDLPHELVDAFRATLEEVSKAYLLLHVIDASSPHYREQIEEVYKVLQDIGATHVPIIEVYNKIDCIEVLAPKLVIEQNPDAKVVARVNCSALTGEGMDLLKDVIRQTAHPQKLWG